MEESSSQAQALQVWAALHWGSLLVMHADSYALFVATVKSNQRKLAFSAMYFLETWLLSEMQQPQAGSEHPGSHHDVSTAQTSPSLSSLQGNHLWKAIRLASPSGAGSQALAHEVAGSWTPH